MYLAYLRKHSSQKKIGFRDKIPNLNVLHAKQKFCRGYREIRRKKKDKYQLELHLKVRSVSRGTQSTSRL